ncbi:MAG: sugar-binding protein [Anaerolineaceae bacterium]
MMKRKAFLAVVLLVLITACNFPFFKEEPQSIFDQPAQTLTAMFAAFPTPTAGTAIQIASPASTALSATQTTAPVATNANVERSAQRVVAKYLSKKPVFDGDWGDWKQSTIAYPAYYVVYGLKAWENDSDCEASFILGWDESFLYVGVKVKDDTYVQNATGAEIFRGDGIELLIDTDLAGDFYSESLNEDDFQIGIAPGKGSINGAKEAYLWYPVSKKGSISDQIDITSTSTAGIYRVEARIPWSVLQITPQAGMRLGFEFSVSDNDNPAENVQQTMVANIATHAFLNPTTWGEIILE